MEQENSQTQVANQTIPISSEEREESTEENTFEVHDDHPSVNEVATRDAAHPSTTFTKVEKSLASLGFFTPSSRRIKNQKLKHIGFSREIDGRRVEVTADIVPSTMFGLPITADQDKYFALQKIITNKMQLDGKVANPIRFKSADLLRLMNDSTKSGKNYKDVSEWLDVMSSTTIISDGAVYVSGKKRFARDRFRVFDRAVTVGKEMEDGSIADANYVWLSAWQLENINHGFLFPVDMETYQQLRNHIAKGLVPLLQVWLYATHKVGSFEKRYEELCEILALQVYKAPSHILRQLKPSLDELTKHEYLASWRIEKTADRRAYKIVFFHGAKFHRDRRRRVEQKTNMEPPLIIGQSGEDEPDLPQPTKTEAVREAPAGIGNVDFTGSVSEDSVLVDTATQQTLEGQSNQTVPLVDELSSHGLMPSVAMKLLASIPTERLDQVQDLIDYWDSLKKTQVVGVGLLYDLIRNGDPLPATFETRRQRADRMAAEKRRRQLAAAEDELREKYEIYYREAVDQFIREKLSPEEFDRRVAAEKATATQSTGLWNEGMRPDLADQLAQHAVRVEIAKDVSVLSLAEFRSREFAGILSRLQGQEPEPLVQGEGASSRGGDAPHVAMEAKTGDVDGDKGGDMTSPPLEVA